MHKRKSLPGELSDATSRSSSQKQRTITDLFSAQSTPGKGEYGQQPLHKRQKLEKSTIRESPVPPPVTRASNIAMPMYGFDHTPEGNGASTPHDARSAPATPPTYHFTPHTGAKKLTVAPAKVKPYIDSEGYMKRSWTQLEDAFEAILRDETPDSSLEQLYRGAENICRLGKAPQLLESIRTRTENYIKTLLLPDLQRRCRTQDNVNVLRAVDQAWSQWDDRLVSTRSIFYYLDQAYLLHSKEHQVLQEQGINQFRTIIFADPDIMQKAVDGTCTLMQRSREEEGFVESDLLRSSVKIFHRLGIYGSDLEVPLLERSKAYFHKFGQFAVLDLKSYLGQVRALIDEEMARCDLYCIDRGTRQRLGEMLDEILIADKRDVLLNRTEIHELLHAKDISALKMLFDLLQRITIGSELKIPILEYLIERGTKIILDEKHSGEMVELLLELKHEIDMIVVKAFGNHPQLQEAVREAFDYFMNKPSTKSGAPLDDTRTGELIAKYVDHILRGGWKLVAARQGKNASQISMNQADEDAEINRQLDQVLELFRFVHGKAVFEAFYKNDLARRLLMGRSSNDEAEQSMLTKLRSECGSQFTHNLETMFTDMDLARSEMGAYNSLLQERNTKRKLDLNVHVLSASAWPSYPDVDVTLPPEVSQALKDFEVFYLSKYHGRKLHWKHSLAYTQLKARFPRGNKEIVVSAYQSLVLLLFNDVADGETLSYKEIRGALRLPDAEVKRTLQSLACAHYRVLTKHPKGRDINDTDTFSLNTNFHADKFRIKINQIQLKETQAENQAMHEKVALDRQFETQAAIVRTMKARRRINHPELVAEVIKATQMRGAVDMAEIKKNIERLIEKEYMERDEQNFYVYVA